MSYEIRMKPQAQDDLRGIFEYIAFTLQSPQNAAGQLDRLEESIDSLEQMPERFRVYDKEPWRSAICVSCRLITILFSTYQTVRKRRSQLSV